MKEISYEGPAFKNEESEWLKNHKRVTRAIPSTPEAEAGTREITPTITPLRSSAIKKVPTYETEHEDHHLGLIIFVLALMLAFGIGVGAYVLIGINKKPEPVPQKEIAVVVTNTVQYTDILLSDSPRAQVLVDIALAFKNTSLVENGVHHVRFLVNRAVGGARQATVRELFQAIRTEPIPETLFTSLEERVTYEIPKGEPLAGKLVLTSRSVPHTFGALFDWEEGMTRTLTPLFHPILSTSYLKDLDGRKFHDERIGSINARVLFDGGENVVLIYGFTDAKTLVIAGNREVFLKESPKNEG